MPALPALVDDLVDAAVIGIEDLARAASAAASREMPSLPGIVVASLMRGIELATSGGRLQSITSRE